MLWMKKEISFFELLMHMSSIDMSKTSAVKQTLDTKAQERLICSVYSVPVPQAAAEDLYVCEQTNSQKN